MVDVPLHSTLAMDETSKRIELFERLERISRLVAELGDAPGEAQRTAFLAERIREEVAAFSHSVHPHQRDSASDGGPHRHKK